METTHRIYNIDSRDVSKVEDGTVDLVVTSPPYPMIEMWDELFAGFNSEIRNAIDRGDGKKAYELMHRELDDVWNEIDRILTDNGIVCVNIGDATRTLDGEFSLYPNHSRIIDTFQNKLNYNLLPNVQWKKPTNSGAKFMGSGMRPPNAYVTLEHEKILIFRKSNTPRQFESKVKRDESAFFWEERNKWFSDTWTDIKGVRQNIETDGIESGEDMRDRSAAYPFMIPYRLINMFSVYEDTVFDPFWGCGTTTLASVVAGRNSIGCEIDENLLEWFTSTQLNQLDRLSMDILGDRVSRHIQYVENKRMDGDILKHESRNYDFPVTTSDEVGIKFYSVENENISGNEFTINYNEIHSIDNIDFQTTEKKQLSLNESV